MFRVRQQIECTDEIVALCQKRAGKKEQVVSIGILDTGISNHPDFSGRIEAFHDFVGGMKSLYDDSGHGTHVAGCIGGNGKLSNGMYKGIAPFCKYVVGKVLDENGDGNMQDMVDGMKWILDYHKSFGLQVLNISIGIGDIEDKKRMNELLKLVDEAWDRGIVVVCAAGNLGPDPMTISPIGASKKVITVGCHDGGYLSGKSSMCETYSGRGPTPYAMKKPDVVAPGTDIISCNAMCRNTIRGYRNAYIQKSGTSMATPIVSGAAALLLQYFPDLTNDQVKRKINYSALDLKEPWTKQGWGMVNVKKLFEYL